MKINHYLDRSWFNGLRYILTYYENHNHFTGLKHWELLFYDLLSKYITFA